MAKPGGFIEGLQEKLDAQMTDQELMLRKWARLFVYHDLRAAGNRVGAEVKRRDFYFLDSSRRAQEIPSDRKFSAPIVTSIQSDAED